LNNGHHLPDGQISHPLVLASNWDRIRYYHDFALFGDSSSVITYDESEQLQPSYPQEIAGASIADVLRVVGSRQHYDSTGHKSTWLDRVVEFCKFDQDLSVRGALIKLYSQTLTKLQHINHAFDNGDPRGQWDAYIEDYERNRADLRYDDLNDDSVPFRLNRIERRSVRKVYRESLHQLARPELDDLTVSDDVVTDLSPGDPIGRDRHYAEIDAGNRYQTVEGTGHYFPGASYHYEGCNQWTYLKGCVHSDHPLADGVRQAHIKRMRYNCGRISCPKCYKDAISRLSVRASERIESYIALRNSQCQQSRKSLKPVHLVYSIPADDDRYDELTTPAGLQRCERRMRRHLHECGISGGVIIYHPFRFRDGEGYFSPHFHIVALGTFVSFKHVSEIAKKHNVMIKFLERRQTKKNGKKHYVINDPEQVISVISYLLSHAGIAQRRHAITWFGELAYNQLQTKTILSQSRLVEHALHVATKGIREYYSYYSSKSDVFRPGAVLSASVTEYIEKDAPQFGDHHQYERMFGSAKIDSWSDLVVFMEQLQERLHEDNTVGYPVLGRSTTIDNDDAPDHQANKFLLLRITGDSIKKSTTIVRNLVIVLSQSTDDLCPECYRPLRILVPVDRGHVNYDGSDVTDLPIGATVQVDNAGVYEELTVFDPRGQILFDDSGRVVYASKIGQVPDHFVRRPAIMQEKIMLDIKRSIERYDQIVSNMHHDDEYDIRLDCRIRSYSDVLGRVVDPRYQELLT